MPWVRVDDHFDEHPKHALAGPLCWALWLAGLAYCNRNLTDGFIPWASAQKLVSWKYLDPPDAEGRQRLVTISITSGMSGEDVTSEMIVQRLVLAGLWKECKGGYKVHDYPDFQPLRNDVLTQREHNAIRQQRHRDRHGVTNAVTDGGSDGVSNAGVTGSPYPIPTPSPGPLPTPVQGKELAARAKAPTRQGEMLNGNQRPLFDRFLAAYPRREAKREAMKAWAKIVPAPTEDLLAVMLNVIEAKKQTKQWLEGIIPLPATWLNQRRWEDEITPRSPLSGAAQTTQDSAARLKAKLQGQKPTP